MNCRQTQLFEKQKEMYQSLTEHQLKIIDEYLADDMKKLKKICDPLIFYKGTPEIYHEDLYGVATDVLIESLDSFDPSKKCSFKTFFIGNVKRAFYDWTRDNTRLCRCNIQTDAEGKIVRDKDGNVIIIPSIPFDEPAEDGTDLREKIASDFSVEDNLSEEIGFSSDDRVELFLGKLGKTQREILKLLMEGYGSLEVKEKLKITDSEYNSAMAEVRKSKHLSLFNKKSGDRKVEKYGMVAENVLAVMEIDTTDSYRMDKKTMLSLLIEKSEGEIDCNYISQRAPFQWDAAQVNKFFTRILNNQPIPEIIICETKENGDKVAYLIDGLQRLSYAEWFKENRIKIGAKGAEFSTIKYRDYVMKEDGSKEIDDKGRAKYEIKTFDVVGKYYRDLPEFLQRRFDDFNVNVTTFFNCTEEMIDYHIRNYNNHCGMTKSQYGITNVNNFTSRNIKLISEEHDFFKDIIQCTLKNRVKGTLEEIVARSLVTLNFPDDWKRDVMDILTVVNENVKDEHYKYFRSLLDRLYAAGCDSIKNMFTSTNAHVWFMVFSKFMKLGFDDSEFIKFMERFQESMKSYKNEDVSGFVNANTYEVFTRKNTKDKSTVQDKISAAYKLMLEFLHIDKNEKLEIEEIVSTYDFVSENVSKDIDPEDVEVYELSLEDYTVEIDEDAKQVVDRQIQAFVALVAYAFGKEVDDAIPGWLVKYMDKNVTYSQNQKENYLHMKEDFENYLVKKGAAA